MEECWQLIFSHGLDTHSKNFQAHAKGVSLATDGWIVTKAQCLQSPPDGLSSQPAIPV